MPFPLLKSISRLLFFLLVSQSVQAQEEKSAAFMLIEDSWRNGKNWLDLDFEREDYWFWSAGAVVVGGTFAYDLALQEGLQLAEGDIKSGLSISTEPFGNPYYMGALALGSYVYGSIANNVELQNLSSLALQSMFTAGLGVTVLKVAFHRERPEEQLVLDPYQFNGPSLSRDNLSFPSGHTAIAFSLASSISAYYDDPLYLAIPLYSLATLTTWQRIYDQKHWPSDVAMGAIIGVFVGRKLATWQKASKVNLGSAILPNGNLGLGLSLALD